MPANTDRMDLDRVIGHEISGNMKTNVGRMGGTNPNRNSVSFLFSSDGDGDDEVNEEEEGEGSAAQNSDP